MNGGVEVKDDIAALRLGIKLNFPRFCGEEKTKEAINTLDNLINENEDLNKIIDKNVIQIRKLDMCTREYVGLLKEVARLNVECCNWIYSPSLSARIDKAIEKDEGVE